MKPAANHARSLAVPPLLLPGLHLILCAITAVISINLPGGAWYRIIPADMLWSLLLMVFDGWLPIFLVFFVLGTVQWWFIGRVPLLRKNARRGQAALGAGIAFFCAGLGVLGAIATVREDLQQGHLTAAAIIQYAGVGLLCAGALYSGPAALRRA